MKKEQFVYVTYIRTTPEKLWKALIEPEFTRKFWCNTAQESEWKPVRLVAGQSSRRPDYRQR